MPNPFFIDDPAARQKPPESAQPNNPFMVDRPSETTPIIDAARFAGTAVVRGLGSLADFVGDPLSGIRRMIDPRLENLEQSLRPHPGQAAGDLAFSATGIPEYEPTTPGGRIGMAAAQGAVAGAPFGIGGALMGAASGVSGQGTMEATGSERLASAAGLAPGVIAGILAARPTQKTIPTAQDLKSAATGTYKALEGSGVEYTPSGISGMANAVKTDLNNSGLFDINAPKTHKFLDMAASPPKPGGSVVNVTGTFANLKSLREGLGTIARETADGRSTPDAVAASRAITALDAFMESPGAMSLAAGTPADAATAAADLRTANKNYAAALRSNRITGTLDRANTGISERAAARAQAANSGRNLDNAIRQRVASLLENPKIVNGFSDAEIAALNDVIEGGVVRNRARDVGNSLSGGGGWGQTTLVGGGALLGGMSGGGPGAAAGAVLPIVVGRGAKAIANSLAKRSLNIADEFIRMNSPLFDQTPPPVQPTIADVAQWAAPSAAADVARTRRPIAANNTVYALARIIASGDETKSAAARRSANKLPKEQQDALASILSSWGVQ